MSVFLLWAIRIIVILFILRFLVRMFSAPRSRPQTRGRRPSGGTLREGGALVRDPQCGTYVPRTSQFVHGTGDAAVHFCSAACLDAWRVAHRVGRAS